MRMSSLQWVVVAAAFALASGVAQGQQRALPAGLQFEQAERTMYGGDEAVKRRDVGAAVELYQKALTEYLRLSRLHPDWEPGMTRFRINYCKDQLRNLMSGKAVVPPPVAAATGGTPPARPAAEAAAVRAEASALLADGNPAEARSLLIDALKSHPDDPGIRLLLGISRCQEGDYVDAMYILESVATDDPANERVCVALAGVYYGLGQVADARVQLARALALNPRCAEAHYNLARVLLAADPPEPAAAQEAYRQSVNLGGAADPGMEAALAEAAAKARSGGWKRFVPFARKWSSPPVSAPQADVAAPSNAPPRDEGVEVIPASSNAPPRDEGVEVIPASSNAPAVP